MWKSVPAAAGLWSGLTAAADEAPDLVVLGVPFEGGAGGAGGASLGPDRVRELSRRGKRISRHGVDFSHLRLRDAGNVATQRFDLTATIAHLRDVYREVFDTVDTPVVSIGGDHSSTYPMVGAAARGRRLGLIWFDAHPDVLDHYQGSHLSHGSPLRRLLDDGAVRPEDVLLVGTRAYDEGEPEYLAKLGVTELRAAEVGDDRVGALDRFRRLATDLAERTDGLYVSVDIDVLDASVVPGTGTPVAGGLDTAVLSTLLEQIPDHVLAYDVMEFAPAHDVGGMTGHAVMSIVTTMIARVAAGSR
ncbi:arginase family protein [Micromonospora sp. NPDC000207]|uniref:arginase family protein n=1 Tax=Micromonospora sp. NPDC000207 TaxID=3154246 RepID=UPI0033284F01